MNGACRVEFFKSVPWPLHIDIAVDFQTIYLNLTKSAGLELEEFLRDCSAFAFDSNTEQTPSGKVHFCRFSGPDCVTSYYTNGPSNTRFSVIPIDNDLALKLADDIYCALFAKQPYIVQERGQVEEISQQPIDPLAKAKLRVDANLKKFFGYA